MKLLLLLLLLGIACSNVVSFQSDELPEDDNEWGLVGGDPVRRSKIDKVDTEYRGNINVGAKQNKPASTTPVGATLDKKIQFTLEHSFGESGFTPAGSFSARLRASAHGRQTLTKLRLARETFSKNEQKAFEDLVREDGFYKVRVPANLVNPRNSYVMASVKARCLAAASLKERFDLNLDQGNLIGMFYSPVGDCTYPRPQVIPSDWTFDTLIVAKSSEQAPRLVPSFEDLSPLREGAKVIEGEDGAKLVIEKTFWQKYWMYIVPFGLIVVNAITQIANMPDDPPAGQAGQAGPASGAATQRIAGSGGARRR